MNQKQKKPPPHPTPHTSSPFMTTANIASGATPHEHTPLLPFPRAMAMVEVLSLEGSAFGVTEEA